MRYMTPDTPSARMLESHEKEKQKQKPEMKTAKMATVTPTPTPKQSPEKTAALDDCASDCASASISTLVPQKRRRAIRTYGSKKRTLEVASDSRPKRQKPTLPASISAVPAAPPPRPRPASTCERLMDEVSRQLQNEAAEAERRRCEEKDKENQAHDTTATATTTKTTTKTTARTKTSRPKTPPKPPTPHKSPRKALGIMRYFQPAAAPRPRTPPPALQVACSPTASISSMSSLSSCPSPTSPLSVCSFEVAAAAEAEIEAEAEAEDTEAVTDSPMSPMVRREQRPRQKRRLTIRPDHAVRSKEDADEEEEKEGGNESEDGPGSLADTPIVKALSGMSSSKTKAKTVQTTLSLTIGPSESGSVRECKACNILYNPLHEKDAKFHARYHASVVGKAKKV